MTGRTAVVTIVSGRGDHLRAQHASLVAGSTRPAAYVVVAMGDSEATDLAVMDLPEAAF